MQYTDLVVKKVSRPIRREVYQEVADNMVNSAIQSIISEVKAEIIQVSAFALFVEILEKSKIAETTIDNRLRFDYLDIPKKFFTKSRFDLRRIIALLSVARLVDQEFPYGCTADYIGKRPLISSAVDTRGNKAFNESVAFWCREDLYQLFIERAKLSLSAME